jgi:hypothetical protein
LTGDKNVLMGIYPGPDNDILILLESEQYPFIRYNCEIIESMFEYTNIICQMIVLNWDEQD